MVNELDFYIFRPPHLLAMALKVLFRFYMLWREDKRSLPLFKIVKGVLRISPGLECLPWGFPNSVRSFGV